MSGEPSSVPANAIAVRDRISQPKERRSLRLSVQLLPLWFSFHDCDVPVDGKIAEALCSAPRLRPLHLDGIDCRPFPQSQNHARIMRRQVTPAADFHPAAPQISRLIGDTRADGVGIRLFPDQSNSQPVVLPSRIISKQYRRTVVDGN